MIKNRLLFALAAAMLYWASPTIAQEYPSKPIRWIVPYAAGGVGDLVARAMAPKLSAILGQQVIVDNRPGAGGVIGTDLAAKAAPDGYTLLLGANASLAITPTLLDKVPYDPIRDFAPISRVGDIPMVLVVSPSLGVNSVRDLIAFAKANPGRLNYASTGNGTASHLSMELFKTATGISLTHIQYKGSPQAITDLLGGQVQLMFDTIGPQVPHVKAGKLKALAVSSAKRIVAMPGVPTVSESGVPDYQLAGWMGALAPAGTPAPIIAKLNNAFVKVSEDPEILDQLPNKFGLEVVSSSPEQFASFINSEIPRWGRVIKASGAKLD